MKKKERAVFIQKMLQNLFPSPEIPLQFTSPYTLLIAVLLSAQCTDERVNKVTLKLFQLADTPEAMSRQSVDEIEEVIRSCGLSKKKADAILRLSKILVEKYNGEVPEDWEALESLPGVGHKTASVVMSQAFHHPAFPVDTHIHRLARRWGLTMGKSVEETERDLKALFPRSCWNLLHLQMIYFGRKFCTARSHNPLLCPICSQFSEGFLESE